MGSQFNPLILSCDSDQKKEEIRDTESKRIIELWRERLCFRILGSTAAKNHAISSISCLSAATVVTNSFVRSTNHTEITSAQTLICVTAWFTSVLLVPLLYFKYSTRIHH